VINLIRERGSFVSAAEEKLVFSRTTAFPESVEVDTLEIQRLGREQSNSSMLIGEAMILKFLRRLQIGVHPELEIGAFLTEQAQFENTPPLLGALERETASGEKTALALVHGFVRNQGDGWSYTLDYLSRFLDDYKLMPTELREAEQDHPHAHYLAVIRRLGLRTAQMHRALAHPGTGPAFAPEAVKPADLIRLRRAVRQQASQAFNVLRRARRKLPIDLHEAVDGLLSRRRPILEYADSLIPKRIDSLMTRCHGDYHLGQVMVVHEDFYILDFEGEPSRTLKERRTKTIPLRDVAGMLRSFNYAAWSALFDRTADEPELRDGLIPYIEDWENQVVEAFEDEYETAIEGCSSHPADPDVRTRLRDLFLLEKVFYEICYEAANRPDWLRIPLGGFDKLIAGKVE
jgi:maltose alpha-D-glucosyltransferase/alpha-amylase